MATYQSQTIAPSSASAALYLAWAQFLGGGFTTCGWTAQTGHGEVVASGTGASYAFTNVVAAPATTGLVGITAGYTFKGAWVSGNTYVGSNTAGGIAADLVTSGGLTYVHITASSSSATAPGSDTTNWQPYNYEIWKSNGGSTGALPIYVRLVYTIPGATGFRIHMSIGTGIDANGNINTQPVTNTTSFVTPVVTIDNSTTASLTNAECDFSGDADNFRFILWRGHPTVNFITMVVVDRAKTSTGTDSDAFFYYGANIPIGGTMTAMTGAATKSTLGVVTGLKTSNNGWPGAVGNGGGNATPVVDNLLGGIPNYPVFPPVGFLANPLLGVMGFSRQDVLDGSILPIWMYGAVHYFLVNSSNSGTGSSINNTASTGVIPAILWE